MEYTCTLPPLSIQHPVFSCRGPLYQLPPFSPTVPWPGRVTPPGARRLAGGASVVDACLLNHKSPQPPPQKPKTLYQPPALGDDPTGKGFLIDRDTGEILITLPPDGLFTTREILWEKAGQDDCKFWLQLYNKDLIVKRPSIQVLEGTTGKRGNIFQFSAASSRRLKFTCRNSGHYIQSQFCCTFHNSWPRDGKSLKAMLERLIKRIKRKFGRGIHYLWVLEFQGREAPHLHLFLDLLPTTENRLFLADAWLDSSGQSADDQCRSFHSHPKNFFTWDMQSGDYLVKNYASKSEQKDVPAAFHNVGRFWGASRNMTPEFSTLDPRDHEEGYKICIEQALRIATRHHEKQIDSFKAFAVLFDGALDSFQVPREEIPRSYKKEVAMKIRSQGEHKTTRLRPKTNFRRRTRTTNLPGRAGVFLDALNYLTAPPRVSGFKAFSHWVDNPNGLPPRRQPIPF